MTGKIITVAQQKGGAGKTTIAANLAVAYAKRGLSVAIVDTDPQGSLGRWFMARIERLGEPDIDFSTASAWGVRYEAGKLADRHDLVLVDTPPKADSDLRPALREADMVIVPVAASHVDLWATEGVLDLAQREKQLVRMVMNRVRAGTRLSVEVEAAAETLGAELARTSLGNRVAYAETLGQGMSVLEGPANAGRGEIQSLADEILAVLAA